MPVQKQNIRYYIKIINFSFQLEESSMKKLIMVGALVLSVVSFSGSAFAAGYGDAGCGLGAIVFGKMVASLTHASIDAAGG